MGLFTGLMAVALTVLVSRPSRNARHSLALPSQALL